MSATDDFKSSIHSLLSAVEAQPEFAQQQSQRKGKVYFMWDFVNSTLSMLEAQGNNRETKMDIMQRSSFAKVLFNDTTGKLTLMTGGDTTDFSADVKAKAATVEEKAGTWAVSNGILRA